MDYEKKYNEALSQARFYYGNSPTESEKKKLEKLFSELSESEDERTRKAILEYLKYHRAGKEFYGITWDDAIAYLEKLKEQEHSLNFDAVSSWLREHASNYVNREFNEFHHCVEYDGTINIEKLIADLKVAVDNGAFDVDAAFDTREPRDNWEYII